MRKIKKSLVRDSSEMSQREEKCFVSRCVSKYCRDLQKLSRRGQIISFIFHVKATVLVTEKVKCLSFVLVLKVTLLTPSAPQIIITHVLEAHHVPGSLLSTLCVLFYLTLTATLWSRCQYLHLSIRRGNRLGGINLLHSLKEPGLGSVELYASQDVQVCN